MSKKITVPALFSALSLIMLYLGNVFEFSTLTLITISSLFIAAVMIECGVRESVLSYIVVSLISLLILPDKFLAVYYIGFFGYYPILKCFIEKKNNLKTEWIIKIIFFVFIMIIAVVLASTVLAQAVISKIPMYLIFILGVAILAIYDFALTLCIDFYMKRIKRR